MFCFIPPQFRVKVSRPKTFDPIRKADKVLFQERIKDPNEGLLYSDFSTQSLIDADAIDLLQPLSPLSVSRLSAIDSVSPAISSLSGIAQDLPVDNVVEPSK